MRTDRVAHGVDRAQPLLERRGAHRRRAHHVGAGLEVGAIGIGTRQVLLDQPHPLERDTLAHRVVMRAGEGLDTMGKGIKPGAGGNRFWHAHGQLGIANHHAGQHLGVEDDLFRVGLGIGDDAGAAHLRAGAGSGRHGDDRCDHIGVGAGPPVANILEIPHRAGLARHEGDHFPKVEAGAAAKGDHAVMAAGVIGRHTRHQVLFVRVRIDLGKEATAQPGGLHHVERGLRHRQRGKATVGHQQRLGDARRRAGLGQFLDTPGTEPDRGRVGPVSNERHFLTFSQRGARPRIGTNGRGRISRSPFSGDRISDGSGCDSRSPKARRRARSACSRSSTTRDRGNRRGS